MACSQCGAHNVDELYACRPPLANDALSEIQRLERNNSALLDTEKQQLGSILTAHNAYHDALVSKRAQVQATLDSLDAEAEQIKESICRMKLVLHPIRDLPNETIHEVLSLLIDEENDSPWCEVKDIKFTDSLAVKRHPIWYLSHVCKRWRHLVLSSPRLWSDFNITLKKPLSSFPSSILVSLFVARSQSQPINVCINDPSSLLRNSQALTELFLNRHRWESLTLGGKPNSFAALEYGSTNFDCLDNVHLSMYSLRYSDSDWTGGPFHGFLHAPKLQFAYVDSPLGEFIKYVALPWHQLVDISLKVDVVDDIIKIFPELTSLTKAELTITISAPEADSLIEVVLENATLHTLSLLYKGIVAPFIGTLRLPALETFSVLHHQNYKLSEIKHPERTSILMCTDTDEGVLIPLPSPTGALVTNLTVTLIETDDPEESLNGLRALLESTPAVTDLEIRLIGHASSDNVFSLLQVPPEDDSPALVPKLEVLSLWAPHSLQLSPVMNEMIDSRWKDQRREGVAKLVNVAVDGLLESTKDVWDRFGELVGEGLDGLLYRSRSKNGVETIVHIYA